MKTKPALWIIAIIFLLWLILLAGCTQVTEVEEFNISGKYQSSQYQDKPDIPYYSIELTLIHTYGSVSGTGRFNTSNFSFQGTMVDNHVEIVFLLIYQGFIYNVKLDLFYRDTVLAGGIDLGDGTTAISFKQIQKINVHNQGSIN